VLRVEERHGEYLVDVVFEKDGKRLLETFPQHLLEPVPDLLQRFQKGESNDPLDFFLKQLAYQFPLENSGGKLSNSRTDLLPHQILLTHQVVNATRRKFLVADEVGLGKTIEVGMIIRELLSRGDARRVLIVCPAGLVENWRNEMRDCFRIYFDIFGQDFTVQTLLHGNGITWRSFQLIPSKNSRDWKKWLQGRIGTSLFSMRLIISQEKNMGKRSISHRIIGWQRG